MLSKAKHKTRLTQNKKAKHTSNAKKKKQKKKKNKNKNKKRRERKSDRITWSIFSSTPWKILSVLQTLNLAMRGKN